MAKNTDRSGVIESSIRQYYPSDGFLSGDRILRTIHSVPLRARVTGSLATTTFACDALAGRGDDAGDGASNSFVGWTVRFAGNPIAATNLTVGESSVVTSYTDAGVFTFGALSGATVRGDEFDLIPPWLAQDVWTYTSASVTMAAGTTGAVNEHEMLAVTGLCRVRGLIVCTDTLTSAGSPIISFGDAGVDAVDNIIGGTLATEIAVGEIWHNASPSIDAVPYANAMWDYVSNGADLGYEITTATVTGGALTFHFWWQALSSGALCAIGTGAAGAL